MNGDQAPLQGWCVLVVEDDYMIGVDMTDILQANGAEIVGPVTRVADALAMLDGKAAAANLAILDLDLNGQLSYPVADALAARGVPFLFTTGYSEEAVDMPYRSHPRLEKPVSERALLAALRQLT